MGILWVENIWFVAIGIQLGTKKLKYRQADPNVTKNDLKFKISVQYFYKLPTGISPHG